MISNTSKGMLRNYIISNAHCGREINIDLGKQEVEKVKHEDIKLKEFLMDET